MTFIKCQSLFTSEKSPHTVIQIRDDQIHQIGGPELLNSQEEMIDLSEHVLLPGFVNAHCHLELTALGPLPYPGSFVKWIQKLLGAKQHLTPEEMKDGIRQGVRKLLNSGVTTVGDHISFNGEWEEIIASPLRGILFGEVLGIVPEIAKDIYANLLHIKNEVAKKSSRFTMTVSPHSIHALHPDTLKDVMEKESGPLSCHIAESETEDDYFKKNAGEMTDFIKRRGIESPHKSLSGIDHVTKETLPMDKLLVIHGNYLNDSEISQIQKNKMSIVYCPGSHAYFAHKPFPLKEVLDKGINVAIGTDSITSNETLDFLYELKLIRKNHPHLSKEAVLTLATINGAKALKMEKNIGSIEAGKKADMIGFKLSNANDPLEAVFKAEKADFVMIDGKVINPK